jgi:hypothetical protein
VRNELGRSGRLTDDLLDNTSFILFCVVLVSSNKQPCVNSIAHAIALIAATLYPNLAL